MQTHFTALLYKLVRCSFDVQVWKCSVQALSAESPLHGCTEPRLEIQLVEKEQGAAKKWPPCPRAGEEVGKRGGGPRAREEGEKGKERRCRTTDQNAAGV